MQTLRNAVFATAVVAYAPALAEPLGLGMPITDGDISAWDIDVRTDGAGLPPGQGTVEAGREIYADYCAGCHGEDGIEPAKGFPLLTGGVGSLETDKPVRTVNSNWPYAPVVFDYVRRAMPFTEPQSLSDDQYYSVVAYLLSLDGLAPKDGTLDAKSLSSIVMPNVDGFIPDGRPDAEGVRCTMDCG